MPTLLKKLGLALGSAAFGLLLCEVVARLVSTAPPNPWREPPIQYVHDSELGFFHVPNQKGWVEDGMATINRLGIRGREVTLPKPANCCRLMVLGDSITLGWGVGDDETYCAQLEQMLRSQFPDQELDVVNCGVSAYDTKQEAALFNRFASLLQPDLVLVGFYWNDILPAYLQADAGPADVDGATRVLVKNPSPEQILRLRPASSWLERNIRRSRMLYLAGRSIRSLTTNPGERDSGQFKIERALLEGELTPAITTAWNKTEEHLRRIRSWCEEHNCPAGIVVLPCREQVTTDYPCAQYQNKAKEIADRLGFFVIDPLPRFVEQRSRVNSLFIPYDRHHPSRAGHRLLAVAIRDGLQAHSQILKEPAVHIGPSSVDSEPEKLQTLVDKL